MIQTRGKEIVTANSVRRDILASRPRHVLRV
jgi:hypothetical protein